MAETKTKPTGVSVADFIAAVDDERKRDEARELVAMMERITGEPATMWGPSIIGFGRYHYRYDSGHEGDAPIAGFSPRKAAHSIYIMTGFPRYEGLMARLGKHTMGKVCLYVKKLDDIDRTVLEELVTLSVKHMREKYPSG